MSKAIANVNYLSISRLVQKSNQLAQNHTVGGRLKKCSNLKELECIHASMIKNSGSQDCFLMNQFITACSTFHRADYAILAFTQMENPNVFVYNAMIRVFLYCFAPIRALQLYLLMSRDRVCPTSYTFSSIVKCSTLTSALGFGEAVHSQIWKFGFGSHLYVQTSLVDFYSNLDKIDASRQVFDEMSERDVFAWTTMVSAYCGVGEMGFARKLFDEMPERNIASWNAMIDGYARLGDVQRAAFLFNSMPTKDLISWTTIITCYSQNKLYREALTVFMEMMTNGVSPDEVTVATVISACAHLGALDLGREIHLYAMQNGFELDVYIGSALIDMYAKCGSLDKALVVFFKLREKNLFCWNSIIEGLAVHGYAEEALSMFSKMEGMNIKPNRVTFVSVLSACTHAGLVEEGRKWFRSMGCYYSIPPEIEHCGCMVDMLCRAGLLDDALEFIRNMKVEPNSVIWGALLGGCKIHKKLEIAQVAVRELMLLEPNNSGYCTILVSMYAETNQWIEVAKIRSTMRKQGVGKRCPGSSWIEVGREIHQFAAADKSHPASEKIFLVLHELYWQLKLSHFISELELLP